MVWLALGSLLATLYVCYLLGLAQQELAYLSQLNCDSPAASFVLDWVGDDFVFSRLNKAAIAMIGPATGMRLCESVEGHQVPLPGEDGLTLQEVYRRVAFNELPRRDALLEFPDKDNKFDNIDGTAYFQQVVQRAGLGSITITCLMVTDRIRKQRQLEALAMRDALTEAYSRNYGKDQLEHAVDAAEKRDVPSAIIFIDLDKFKPINDTYGHAVGDWVLCQVGDRISAELRPDDCLCRWGGDEFLILLWGSTQSQGYSVAQRVRQAISHPYDWHGHTLQLSGSIGVSEIAPGGVGAAEALDQADKASYRAKKEHGGNAVVSWDPAVSVEWNKLERIKQGIAAGEFVLHYQPIVDLKQLVVQNGKPKHPLPIAGYEALSRWIKDGKVVAPSEFIDLLESTGNLHLLCRQIFTKAAAQQAKMPDQWISVNLSPATLERPDFAEIIRPWMTQPCAGHLEITERLKLSENARQLIQSMQRQGVRFAIDDFGAGEANLKALINREICLLKLDKFLVDQLGTKNDSFALCSALVTACHSLGVHVVAEGVEEPEQVRSLQLMHCDFGQGYLFAKAAPLTKYIGD